MLSLAAVALFLSSVSASHLNEANWHHPRGHPIEKLFARNTDATPTFGSPAWQSQYPSPDNNWPPKSLPSAWTATLASAVAAGKIPNVPVPTMGASGNPEYPNGLDPTGKVVCSATYECRGAGEIWDGPDGTVALAFDDGPLAPSPRLYEFLKEKGVHATHFFIGGNVRANPDIFLQAYVNNSDPISVHTYTHPYMTIQTNEGVLAELGWTMQIIYDSTGGRVPKFWRPPYGDVDNRVRAIASEVFGLTTVIWNQDSEDWELTYGAIPLSTVENNLKSFYSMKKSPGLVILEHELSDNSVNAFMYSWNLLTAGGWKPITIPDAANVTSDPGNAWYQNAQDDSAAISSVSFGTGPQTALPGSSSSTTTSTTGSATSFPESGTMTKSTSNTGSSPTSGSPSSTTTSSSSPSSTSGAASPRAPGATSAAGLLSAVALLFAYFG